MSTNNDKKTSDLASNKRLLDNLQNDLRSISNEAKKKIPALKETAESGIVRLRSASSRCSDLKLGNLCYFKLFFDYITQIIIDKKNLTVIN